MAYASSDHRPVSLPSFPELGSESPPTGSDSGCSCPHSGGSIVSRGNALKFWSSVGPVLQLCIFLGSLVQADNQPTWSQCSHVYNGLVTGHAAPTYS